MAQSRRQIQVLITGEVHLQRKQSLPKPSPTRPSNETVEKGVIGAKLSDKPSLDHTHDTLSTRDTAESYESDPFADPPAGPSVDPSADPSADSNMFSDMSRQRNIVTGPGSIEYSVAPQPVEKKRELQVETTVENSDAMNEAWNEVHFNRTRTVKDLGAQTQEHPVNYERSNNATRLTTISMPDTKYFANSRTENQHASDSFSQPRLSYSQDRTDYSFGNSTLTSLPDMPPAMTVTNITDDSSNSDEYSRSTNHFPPMASIGDGGSCQSRFSQRSKKSIGEVKERLLRNAHDAAVGLMKRGEVERALDKFEDIRDVLVEEYHEEHVRVGSAYHNIGVVMTRCEFLDDASEALNEAIHIRRDMLGDYHPKVSESMLELGVTLMTKKCHKESLAVFNETLQILRKLSKYREQSPEEQDRTCVQMTKVLNNIGCLYFELKENEMAIESFQHALEMQRKLVQKDGDNEVHAPVVLSMTSTLCNLAYVHMANEEYDDAIESLDLAANLQQSVFHEGNPVVISTLNILAFCHSQECCHDTAIRVYEEVLEHHEASYGENSLDCAITKRNIACCHVTSCQFDEALAMMYQVERIQEQRLAPESRRLRKTISLIQALEAKKRTCLSTGELLVREMSKLGANQFMCGTSSDKNQGTDAGSLEGLTEIERPPINVKLSGHRITYA